MSEDNELRLGGDTSGAVSALGQLEDQAKSTAAALDKIAAMAADAGVALDATDISVRSAYETINDFGKELGLAGDALEKWTAGQLTGLQAADALTLSHADLRKALSQAVDGLGLTGKETEQYVASLNKADEAMGALTVATENHGGALLAMLKQVRADDEEMVMQTVILEDLKNARVLDTEAIIEQQRVLDDIAKRREKDIDVLGKLKAAQAKSTEEVVESTRKHGELGRDIKSLDDVYETWIPNIVRVGVTTKIAGEAVSSFAEGAKVLAQSLGVYSGQTKEAIEQTENLGKALSSLDAAAAGKALGQLSGTLLSVYKQKLDEATAAMERNGRSGELAYKWLLLQRDGFDAVGVSSANSTVILSEHTKGLKKQRDALAEVLQAAGDYTASHIAEGKALDTKAQALVRVAVEQMAQRKVEKGVREDIKETLDAYVSSGRKIDASLAATAKQLGITSTAADNAAEAQKLAAEKRAAAEEAATARIKVALLAQKSAVDALFAAQEALYAATRTDIFGKVVNQAGDGIAEIERAIDKLKSEPIVDFAALNAAEEALNKLRIANREASRSTMPGEDTGPDPNQGLRDKVQEAEKAKAAADEAVAESKQQLADVGKAARETMLATQLGGVALDKYSERLAATGDAAVTAKAKLDDFRNSVNDTSNAASGASGSSVGGQFSNVGSGGSSTGSTDGASPTSGTVLARDASGQWVMTSAPPTSGAGGAPPAASLGPNVVLARDANGQWVMTTVPSADFGGVQHGSSTRRGPVPSQPGIEASSGDGGGGGWGDNSAEAVRRADARRNNADIPGQFSNVGSGGSSSAPSGLNASQLAFGASPQYGQFNNVKSGSSSTGAPSGQWEAYFDDVVSGGSSTGIAGTAAATSQLDEAVKKTTVSIKTLGGEVVATGVTSTEAFMAQTTAAGSFSEALQKGIAAQQAINEGAAANAKAFNNEAWFTGDQSRGLPSTFGFNQPPPLPGNDTAGFGVSGPRTTYGDAGSSSTNSGQHVSQQLIGAVEDGAAVMLDTAAQGFTVLEGASTDALTAIAGGNAIVLDAAGKQIATLENDSSRSLAASVGAFNAALTATDASLGSALDGAAASAGGAASAVAGAAVAATGAADAIGEIAPGLSSIAPAAAAIPGAMANVASSMSTVASAGDSIRDANPMMSMYGGTRATNDQLKETLRLLEAIQKVSASISL